MEMTFYLGGFFAIFFTILVILHTKPIYSLLCMIISIISLSAVFFSLGAYFSGAVEIIVYAGAILVLFLFFIMMLNVGKKERKKYISCLNPSLLIGPGCLSIMMLGVLIFCIHSISDQGIVVHIIDPKYVGISIFGPYVLSVELASMLLLSGLIVAFHISRVWRNITNRNSNREIMKIKYEEPT